MDSNSELVERMLARPDTHEQWAKHYRTNDNEAFFERAYDFIIRELNAPAGSTILDAGCGSCAHSLRLARRGFQVVAVDFSASALEMARQHVASKGMAPKIHLQRESLLRLTFPDHSFSFGLCWGVLMHIPDVEKAVSELSRVIKPEGMLVVSEGNAHSFDAYVIHSLKRLMRKEKAEIKDVPAGREFWKISGSEALVTRQANIAWLVQAFADRGLKLHHRVAGQFSEAYAMTSLPVAKKLVHNWNNFWFRSIQAPGLAYGNILIFRKESASTLAVTDTRF
jgi:2-polyprenyl-3-methyl-5-hydroxy-6-metoxy-1,4-benzoquinol methylase